MKDKPEEFGRSFVDENGVLHWVSPYATMTDEEIKTAKEYAFVRPEIEQELIEFEQVAQVEPVDKKKLTVFEMADILAARRAEAKAEAEAQVSAEQAAINRDFPEWLLEFADQLMIPRQYDDLLAFKEWIVYVLEYARTKRGGRLSVNPTFKRLRNSEFAPFPNVSSQIFFIRLFRILEQEGFLIPGYSHKPRRLIEGAIERLK